MCNVVSYTRVVLEFHIYFSDFRMPFPCQCNYGCGYIMKSKASRRHHFNRCPVIGRYPSLCPHGCGLMVKSHKYKLRHFKNHCLEVCRYHTVCTAAKWVLLKGPEACSPFGPLWIFFLLKTFWILMYEEYIYWIWAALHTPS